MELCVFDCVRGLAEGLQLVVYSPKADEIKEVVCLSDGTLCFLVRDQEGVVETLYGVNDYTHPMLREWIVIGNV